MEEIEELEKLGFKKFEKLEINPFLADDDGLIIPLSKKAEKLSMNSKIFPIDETTGDKIGYTKFLKVKICDSEQFTKIYREKIPLIFELNKPAQKVLGFIWKILKTNDDRVLLDRKKCMEDTKIKTEKTIYTGLTELCQKGFIAKSQYSNFFYINHKIFFNGNRQILIGEFIRQRTEEEEAKYHLQRSIPFGEITSTENNEPEIETKKAIAEEIIENNEH